MNNSNNFFWVLSTNQGPVPFSPYAQLINSKDDINADGRQKRPRKDDINAED